MKKWIVPMAALMLVFSLSACGAKETAKTEPAAASAGSNSNSSSSTASSSAGQQVKLVATNFQFDQKEYKVKKGEEVTFTLENKDGLHGVAITGLNVNLSGGKMSQTVKPDKAGSYDIICNIPCGPGHISMKSKLIVE